MKADLKAFYRLEKVAGVSHAVEVQDITPGMMGTANSPTLNLKAGEPNHFLPFVVVLLKRHRAGVPLAELLVQAGEPLLRVQALIRQYKTVLPDAAIEDCTSQREPF